MCLDGKTLLVSTLSETLNLDFSRIQFTPDLLPSDMTGTEVAMEENEESGERSLRFIPGPVFANLILADEINRTPPKTQAALLEAMQEGQVTAGGKTHELPEPFFVLATQNPIEQEGTYPFPKHSWTDSVQHPHFVPRQGRRSRSSSGRPRKIDRLPSPSSMDRMSWTSRSQCPNNAVCRIASIRDQVDPCNEGGRDGSRIRFLK